MARDDTTAPVEELSDRQLRSQVKKARQTIDEIDRLTPAEAVRGGRAEQTLARYGAAVTTLEDAGAELARRESRSRFERLPLARQLRDSAKTAHAAVKPLQQATRMSFPELRDARLVAERLTVEQADELSALLKKRRSLGEGEQPEQADVERIEMLLGIAAGDPEWFANQRTEAARKTRLAELKEAGRVAALPRHPLLAEPGSVQFPREIWASLTNPKQAYEDTCFGLADVGVLYALWATFANDSTALFPGSRFEGEGDDRRLVLPAMAGAEISMFGRIAGSSVNPGASGHVRPWPAIHTLALNDWIEVEQTVSEMRIRLGERARKPSSADVGLRS